MKEKESYSNLSANAKKMKAAMDAQIHLAKLEALAKKGEQELPADLEKIRTEASQQRLNIDETSKKSLIIASSIGASILIIGVITALIIRKNRKT